MVLGMVVILEGAPSPRRLKRPRTVDCTLVDRPVAAAGAMRGRSLGNPEVVDNQDTRAAVAVLCIHTHWEVEVLEVHDRSCLSEC